MLCLAASLAFEARRALDSDGEVARFIRDAGYSHLATPESLAKLYDVLAVETVEDLENLADDEEYSSLGIRSNEAHALQLSARVENMRKPLAEDFGVANAAAVARALYRMDYTDLLLASQEMELDEALKAGLTEDEWRMIKKARMREGRVVKDEL